MAHELTADQCRALYKCYTTLRALYENLPSALSHLPLTAASALVEAFPEVAGAEAKLDEMRVGR